MIYYVVEKKRKIIDASHLDRNNKINNEKNDDDADTVKKI
jgi:hypothetical protein